MSLRKILQKAIESRRTRRVAKAIAIAPFAMPVLAGAEGQAKETEKPKISGCISSTISSSYLARPGFVVSDKGVLQNLINLNSAKLSGFVWSDFNLDTGNFDEVDIGLQYQTPVTKSLSARVNYQYWDYPSASADGDSILEAGLHYSGPIEADLTVSHLFGHGDVSSGEMFQATLAKPVNLDKGKVLITPSVTATYLQDFFGVSGLSAITPGVELQYEKGPLSLGLFAKKQFGFKEQMPEHTQYGARIGLSF